MSTVSLYVQAASKSDLNRRLMRGETVLGIEVNPWETHAHASHDWPVGSSVRIYSKKINGQPYAKAYGTVCQTIRGGTRVV